MADSELFTTLVSSAFDAGIAAERRSLGRPPTRSTARTHVPASSHVFAIRPLLFSGDENGSGAEEAKEEITRNVKYYETNEPDETTWDADFLSSMILGAPSPSAETFLAFRNMRWFNGFPDTAKLQFLRKFLHPQLIQDFADGLYFDGAVEDIQTGYALCHVPLFWALRFITQCVYDQFYSTAALGRTSRPCIAAVLSDMSQLAKYLSTLGNRRLRPLSEVLTDFLQLHTMLSILNETSSKSSEPANFQPEMYLPYLSDLFQIISCCNLSLSTDEIWTKLDGWDFRNAPKWTQTIRFPGPDYLIYGARTFTPSTEENISDSALDFFDAGFICSGPFKLRFTGNLGEHLTFNDKRELRVFCGGRSKMPVFSLLQGHRLAGEFQASSVEAEIQRQLELLFTRSSYSLRILGRLLGLSTVGMNLYLVNRMVFLKYARDDPAQLAEWMKQLLPRMRAFAGTHGGSSGSVVYRSDQAPMDKWTMTKVINRAISKSSKSPKNQSAKVKGGAPTEEEQSKDSNDGTDDFDTTAMQDFEIFVPHLLQVQKQMLDWKPQSFRDFFVPGYSDRVAWITAITGVAFGILGCIWGIAAIIQAITGAIALKVAYQSLNLQQAG